MFQRQIGGGFVGGRSAEEMRRGGALIETIRVALSPYMDAEIREPAMKAIMEPAPLAEEDIRAWTHIIGAFTLLDGGSLGETRRKMREAREGLRHPAPPTSDEAEALYQETLSQETLFIVKTWLDVLVYQAEGYPNDVVFTSASGEVRAGAGPSGAALGTLVAASRLDDAMLPPMDDAVAEIFSVSCNATHAGVRGVRAALVAYRRSLPAGRQLPDEVVEFLAIENISVTP